MLVGAHSRYFVIDTREQRAVLGVSFRPGGMWPFFDPAADELHNQHVALRICGVQPARRCASAAAAADAARELLLLEAELLERAIRPIQRRAEIDFALDRLTHAPQIIRSRC